MTEVSCFRNDVKLTDNLASLGTSLTGSLKKTKDLIKK